MVTLAPWPRLAGPQVFWGRGRKHEDRRGFTYLFHISMVTFHWLKQVTNIIKVINSKGSVSLKERESWCSLVASLTTNLVQIFLNTMILSFISASPPNSLRRLADAPPIFLPHSISYKKYGHFSVPWPRLYMKTLGQRLDSAKSCEAE